MRLRAAAWKTSCYVFGALVLSVLIVQGWFFVHVWWWSGHNPSSTAFMQARLATLQQKNANASLRRQWIG